MKILTRGLPVLIALVMLAGPARGDTAAGSTQDLRAGFFLLHQVCDQESQVDMLNIIKTTPPDVGDYVKRVSGLAKESLASLDRFADRDSSLRDTTDPLPRFEQATRKNIQDEKEHQLLFGTKGITYVRRLLFSQIQAATYIVNLSKTWTERDPDAERAAAVRKLSERWAKIRDEGLRMLDKSS
jgi:hypothetical protein